MFYLFKIILFLKSSSKKQREDKFRKINTGLEILFKMIFVGDLILGIYRQIRNLEYGNY